MKNLLILCLCLWIGAGAIASSPKDAAIESLQATVEKLQKKVDTLESSASKSAASGHGHDDLEERVTKLEKVINGSAGANTSGLESRLTKLETSVSKLEVTVRQI